MNTQRPLYVRPSIQRHRAGHMNKMGGAPALRPQRQIDGVPVEELVGAYGSPCFVYSERSIVARYHELRDALARRWPRVQLAWSYKTCYLDAVCRVYHREGSWAECVSDMEVEKALRNGVPMHQVIYNGPHKKEAMLERALLGGARVNVDHFDELLVIERIAARHGRCFDVGLRVNMAAGAAPRWDRFGFNLDSGQAWDAARRMLAGGRVRPVGLHCHVGTFVLDVEAYRECATKLAVFANRLYSELGQRVDYLDLGGGFASRSRLKSQYLPGEQASPSLSQYAEAVSDGLTHLDLGPGEPPTLFLETGRALIDEAGTLITTALANKRLADGRRAVILDAGVNVLFTSFWYKHDVTPTRECHGTPEPTVLYGPLCMNIDVVRDQIMMPPVEVGARLLVHPVGAYNVTQSMQFIHLRPAVVLISERGEHACIRRAETLDDLVIGEQLPPWMNG